MINAKEELLKKAGNARIVWAKVYVEWEDREDSILKPNHTQKELEEFLNSLDFVYNNGYGTDYIGGTVMLSDGSWLERREYDGSEWWEKRHLPTF